MKPAVPEIFKKFSVTLEGDVPWMYLDVKGWVTVGIGCKIDPITLAIGLRFVDRTTHDRATPDEIGTEWRLIKGRQSLAHSGAAAAGRIATLELTRDTRDELMFARLELNDTILASAFPQWDSWPADAQLGVHSMAWAMGAGFTKSFPKFTAAARAGDWETVVEECAIRETGNAGMVERNKANRGLFRNALRIVQDLEKVHWP